MPRPKFQDETETLVRELPSLRPLGALVRVAGAQASPAEKHLSSGRCVIGSAQDCDVVVHHPTVSRRHAELKLVPEGVLVRDLGSHNGTFCFGQRIESMVLSFGGRLQVGAATVSVDVDVEALGASLAPYPADRYRGLIGPSQPMRRLFATLARLEGSLVTVLVEGESGVGKELIAEALHHGSSVADGPFVTLNCGAIAPDLVASELFGHRRGAFTGASEARQGAFVSADGGTLFLDEVGELPIGVQPMLLRALESGEVRAVGEDAPRRVKVRLVAATNRRLADEVRAGRFREDLYYRLAVVHLTVPPLRERPEDVEALARELAARLGIGEPSAEVIDRLRARAWPGNVRELRNVMEAFAALGMLPEPNAPSPSTAPTLDGLLRARIDVTRPYTEQKDALVERFTTLYLDALLEHTAGNQTSAAELAGLGRTYLGRLLQKHAIRKR